MPTKEQYFDQFSNFSKLKKEKDKILDLLTEIEVKMASLSKKGININLANSIREVEETVRSLERTAAELGVVRKEYAITASKVIELKKKEAQATKEMTRNEALDVVQRKEKKKQLIEEAQLRNAAIGSLERNQLMVKKLERDLSKVNTTTAEGAAQQAALNEQLENYNRLIDQQTGRKRTASGTTPVPQQTPVENIPFSHNLKQIEEQNKALETQKDVLNDIEKVQTENQIAAMEWADAQKVVTQETKATASTNNVQNVTQYRDELERLTGTLGENVDLLALNKKELDDVRAEIASMEGTTSKAEKSTDRYKNRIQELRAQEVALKNDIRQLTYLTKQQTIEQNLGSGALEKMIARYNQLKIVTSQFTAEQRKSSVGKALILETVTLDKEIQKLKRSTAQIHDATNSMSNSITRSFGRVIGYLRNIAYLIPGIGIGGLIGLVINPIIDIFRNVDEFGDKLKERVKDIVRDIRGLRAEASAGVAGDISNINALSEAILDQTKSYDERNAALKKLREVNKAYFGDLTLEKAELGLLKEALKEYTDALIANAVVKGFLDEISKVSIEFAKIYDEFTQAGEQLDKFQEQYDELIAKQKQSSLPTDPTSQFESTGTEEQAEINRLTRQISQQRDALAKITQQKTRLEKGLREAYELALKYKPLETPGGAGDGSDRLKNFDDLLKKQRDALLEIAKDEQRNIKDRTNAREAAYEIDLKLLENKYKVDLANAKGNVEEIKNIEENAAYDRAEIKAKSDAEILAMNLKFQQDLADNSKASREIADKGNDFLLQQVKDRIEAEGKLREKEDEAELLRIKNNYDEQINALDRKFLKGKISEKNYNKERLKIEAEYQAESLKQQIEAVKAQIKVAEALNALEQDPEKKEQRAAEIEVAKQKLEGLRNALDAVINEIFKKGKNLENDWVGMFEKIADVARKTFDIIAGFANAQAEKQKNAIQEQIDALEVKRQKDIEVATQTIANEQQRADAIAEIDAKANAQRNVYEIQQRQAEERAARFEKASTIAQITLATALAVIKALTEGDPLTKIPRAIAAGAIGAAQLAVAIATPIPKYATGTDSAKPGLGIAGEKGRELYVDNQGRLGIFDKPTLTDFQGGEKIFSNRVTEDIISSMETAKAYLFGRKKEKEGKEDQILATLKKIEKKPPVTVVVKDNLEATAYYIKNMKS